MTGAKPYEVNRGVQRMSKPEKLLSNLKLLLEHMASVLDADVSVALWNGDVVPLCARPSSGLALQVRDPGVVSSLLRSPRILTVISLFADGRLRINDGTLLDLEPRRQDIENKLRAGAWRRIDKWLAARLLAPFLAVPRMEGAADHRALASSLRGRSSLGGRKARDDTANVQFHYDLSNEFYALFLDPLMVYSCAYFPKWEATLAEAQHLKLDMICRKLRLQPGETFFDIGCGWGGLVIHAAANYGVKAHGTTLSQAQYEFARARIASLGLQDRVSVELADFRSVEGTFDKIASVGMYEHIGAENLDGYFAKVGSLLRTRGLYLHHAIVRRARPAHLYRKQPMSIAISKYIFPGGYLDHLGSTIANLEKHEFDVHDVEGLREHYALTCRKWTERLYASRLEAARIVGEARTHLWLLYLARSAIAFDRGASAIFQTLASKRAPGASGLPPTRDDLYAAVAK